MCLFVRGLVFGEGPVVSLVVLFSLFSLQIYHLFIAAHNVCFLWACLFNVFSVCWPPEVWRSKPSRWFIPRWNQGLSRRRCVVLELRIPNRRRIRFTPYYRLAACFLFLAGLNRYADRIRVNLGPPNLNPLECLLYISFLKWRNKRNPQNNVFGWLRTWCAF